MQPEATVQVNESATPGVAEGTGGTGQPSLTPELLAKLVEVRTRTHELFGRIALQIMTLPRYRHLPIADLQHILLEPLIHDRIMFAQAKGKDGTPDDNAHLGIAFWASVSEEVDARIREQIEAGVFPVRLQPKDWVSGSINWLLDVVALNASVTEGMVGGFLHAKKDEQRHIHPFIVRQFKPETLARLGLTPEFSQGQKEAAS